MATETMIKANAGGLVGSRTWLSCNGPICSEKPKLDRGYYHPDDFDGVCKACHEYELRQVLSAPISELILIQKKRIEEGPSAEKLREIQANFDADRNIKTGFYDSLIGTDEGNFTCIRVYKMKNAHWVASVRCKSCQRDQETGVKTFKAGLKYCKYRCDIQNLVGTEKNGIRLLNYDFRTNHGSLLCHCGQLFDHRRVSDWMKGIVLSCNCLLGKRRNTKSKNID